MYRSDSDSGPLSDAVLRDMLAQADHRATVAASQDSGVPENVVPNHAYTVLGRSRNTVSLRNPQGGSGRRGDFRLSTSSRRSFGRCCRLPGEASGPRRAEGAGQKSSLGRQNMADTFTQENRLISIETPLGPDALLLRSFVGAEGISRLFHFHLDLMSEDPNIDFDRIIGQNVNVSVRLADPSSHRYFNGHVSKFVQLPGEGRLARYQADMVPWLWFLTRSSDCRIFQNKSVPDIVQEVFQDFGFTDFENQLQGNYQPWEYCVQYRETAFNFVTRLLEQEGIFFFFRHENGKHVLVLADAPSAHRPCPDMPSARYEHVVGRGYNRDEDFVFEWRAGQEMRPGKYALNDYNFETPSTSLLANVDSRIDQGGNLRFEVYDYPGEYLRRDQGDALVRLRMEEQELPHAVVDGESNCRAFASGFRFELTEHERRDQNTQYVLTSVTHSAHSGSFFTEQRRRGRVLRQHIRLHPVLGPVPASAHHAQAPGARPPDRRGSGPFGGRDSHGQARPRQGAVSLGPARHL